MPKLTYKEVLLLKGWTRDSLLATSIPCTLQGMDRDLDEGDILAISYLRGSLQFMNSKGLLIPDWEKRFEIQLWHQDSEPDADYHDYPDEELQKK